LVKGEEFARMHSQVGREKKGPTRREKKIVVKRKDRKGPISEDKVENSNICFSTLNSVRKAPYRVEKKARAYRFGQ